MNQAVSSRRQLYFLLIANPLCAGAMMSIIPLIGPLITELKLEPWHGGLLTAVSGLMWMLTARSWGIASDKYGRKKILLIGIFGAMLSFWAMNLYLHIAFITPMAMWLSALLFTATRGLIGFFYAAVPGAAVAKITDLFPPEKRRAAMASFGASNGVGMVLGPMAGGMLAAGGLIVPLTAAAVLPVIAMILIAVGLKHDRPHVKAKQQPIAITDARIRLPVFASFISFAVIMTNQITVSFYMIDVFHLDTHHAAQWAGYAMGAVGVVMILVQIISMRLSFRLEYFLIIGSVIAALACVLVTNSKTPIHLVWCYCLMPVGLGLLMPAMQALCANAVESHEQGGAAGTLASAQGLAMVIAPLAAMFIYHINPHMPYYISSALMALLFVMSVLYLRRQNQNAKS